MPSQTHSRPALSRIAVVTHGRPERIGDARARLAAVAQRAGVQIVENDADAELAVVLGGDGTTLRALHRFLDTPVPCLGINFGRVGFLTSISGGDLEEGLAKVFAGHYEVLELPTLECRFGQSTRTGVNDVVLASGSMGRMVIVEWVVDGNPMGELGCDGAIMATATGSTAYNLSAGGPVLAWGTDGFVVSFVSPHSLHARSMVLGRDHTVKVANRSDDVPIQVVVDGHAHGEVPPGGSVIVAMGARCAKLARIEGHSFFRRYRETFST